MESYTQPAVRAAQSPSAPSASHPPAGSCTPALAKPAEPGVLEAVAPAGAAEEEEEGPTLAEADDAGVEAERAAGSK